MSKYESELFNFMTKDENFESICDLVENFSKLKDDILFKMYSKSLELIKIKCEGTNWKVDYDEELNYVKTSQIWLYKDSYFFSDKEIVHVAISIENMGLRPYYGVWTKFDTNLFDTKNVRLESKKISGWQHADAFICWKYLDYNFNTKETFDGIKKVQSNSGSVSEFIAEILMKTAIEFENFIEENILKIKS
jgi:hypothetical protein